MFKNRDAALPFGMPKNYGVPTKYPLKATGLRGGKRGYG
jgi:hypothetical protein